MMRYTVPITCFLISKVLILFIVFQRMFIRGMLEGLKL
jgi:ABC-type glycerol-3-phosphate transport system permease component